MAHVDDLISDVDDVVLRERLQRAVDTLRKGKAFGLVFEEHIPESVLLPSAGLQPGSLIIERGGSPRGPRYEVMQVDGDKVEAALNEEHRTLDLSDVLVVKRFGEPVYPVLTPVGAARRAGDEATHVVINGENFHALQLLLFQHKGEVDCIYIDPPYNTGERNWQYNNDYVDQNDTWRHSKWLSFMEKRLKLARDLLHEDGVLIVTIDENEVHHLGVLLEDIFPKAMRQMVTIVINPAGASADGISRVEEYAFFCFLGASRPVRTTDNMLVEERPTGRKIRWESLMRGGNTWYRARRENLCYPVFIDPKTQRIVRTGPPLQGDDESARVTKSGKLVAAWPVRNDGRLGIWRVEGPTLEALAKKGYAYVSSENAERGTWTIRYLMEGTLKAIEDGRSFAKAWRTMAKHCWMSHQR